MTAQRLRIELCFPLDRTPEQYRQVLQQILAWRPDLAPRELERSSDADAPDRPEPWTDARWAEVAALAAGDRPRSWSLVSEDGALVIARERACTRISIVMPRPSADPFEVLVRLVERFEPRDVPAFAMAFDPESKQDEGLIMQGLERLADVPPVFYADRRTALALGGAGKLSSGAQEVRDVHGGVAVRVRRVYGRLTADDRARGKAMRSILGLPRSLAGGALATEPTPELVQYWPTGAEGRFCGVWSAAPDVAWAVGDAGMIARWDGDDWALVDSRSTAWLAAVSGWEDRAWAVGEHGEILAWDGNTWSAVTSNTDRMLHGVHAIARDRAVAVGEGGCIVAWDGRTWADAPSATQHALHAVSGARGELWAVGEAGTITRYIDGRWTIASSPVRTDLHAVSVIAPGEAWAAGAHGCVLYLKDDLWREIESGSDTHLHGILANSSEDVWLAGDECTIRHWNGRAWSTIACDGSEDLLAICAATDRDVWLVGSDTVILRVVTG